MTFALYFGNRGFFPEHLIASARQEVIQALAKLDIKALCIPDGETRYGAVEGFKEGRKYAQFLEAHRGDYDGVVLILPNFGDEAGASEALRDCGTPIYVQAYPDELSKMDFASRRDAFCGKLSIMDVFNQFRIPYTAWMPHTLHPSSDEFVGQMKQFAAVCRIVGGMKRCRFGAIGARPTAFKTIRFDEVALQNYGITTEVYDNSDLLVLVGKITSSDPALKSKIERFRTYSNFERVPDDKLEVLSKVSLAIDRLMAENGLDAIALRCWNDLQETLRISVCVVLSELNDRGVVAACELDIGNTLSMYALRLASGEPAACLDWNNNYTDDPDRCILFHCGSTAQKMMTACGDVVDHAMFAKALGPGCAFGCNVGRIRPMDFTFASTTTIAGKILYYAGEGNFTEDPIPPEFFGCGGVARIPGLQTKINRLGRAGYRHHVGVTSGFWHRAVEEAFSNYLGYDKTDLEK